MGTELNLDLLDGMGFAAPEGAGPNDLLIAIRADDDEAVARGKAEPLDAALARSSAGGSGSAGLGAPRRRARPARRPVVRPRTSRWSRSPARTRSPRRWTRWRPA